MKCFPDLGHCRPGAIPVARSGFLPWSRLLCSSLRRDLADNLQKSRKLARWVSYPGFSQRSGELSICRNWQQNRSWESFNHDETCTDVVSNKKQHSLLWDISKGSITCWRSLRYGGTKCARSGEWSRIVWWFPWPNQTVARTIRCYASGQLRMLDKFVHRSFRPQTSLKWSGRFSGGSSNRSSSFDSIEGCTNVVALQKGCHHIFKGGGRSLSREMGILNPRPYLIGDMCAYAWQRGFYKKPSSRRGLNLPGLCLSCKSRFRSVFIFSVRFCLTSRYMRSSNAVKRSWNIHYNWLSLVKAGRLEFDGHKHGFRITFAIIQFAYM